MGDARSPTGQDRPCLALGDQPAGYRSGFVAVIGLPNAGKSTLVNALLGRAPLITSDKPQTTRYQVRCVSTTPARQVVFVDTPGWLKRRRKIDKAMHREIQSGIDGVDVVVYVVDGLEPRLEQAAGIVGKVRQGRREQPFVVAVTKVDRLGKLALIPLLDRVTRVIPDTEVVPVASPTADNLAELDRVLTGLLPEGPVLYPPETLVDRPDSFLVAEFLREQIFLLTRDEVPFGSAVEVESIEEADGVLQVSAVLFVERKSQKGIMIGKQGRNLRAIRRRACQRLKDFLGVEEVELDLFVKVAENWREDDRRLREFGIGVEE